MRNQWKQFSAFAVYLFAGVVVLLAACDRPSHDSHAHHKSGSYLEGTEVFHGLKGKLRIEGCSAILPIAEEAARHIQAHNSGVHVVAKYHTPTGVRKLEDPAYSSDIQVSITGKGSDEGIRRLGEGLIDIATAGRPITDEEQLERGFISFPTAIDIIAVVVHPSNPITDLSADRIRDIFLGRIVNWKEVGGPDRPIHVYHRNKTSSTRATILAKLVNDSELPIEADVVTSNGAMQKAVAGDEDGIGYHSIGYIDEKVKAILVDGVTPTRENVRNDTYRIIRTLYMNTRKKPSELTRAFIDYVTGEGGAKIIREAGYLPIQ